jgi:hypothetical protein
LQSSQDTGEKKKLRDIIKDKIDKSELKAKAIEVKQNFKDKAA